jgi:hypothetical protein
MACKEAAGSFGDQFEETEDVPDWPKGCYESNDVYFNQHGSGSANINAAQICKSAVSVTSENCAIGLKVQKGKDWTDYVTRFGHILDTLDHVDGKESIGTITVCYEHKVAEVKLDDGKRSDYRIGSEGYFDLFAWGI